ncbi:hypothetical protein GS491_26325 [Rhodococcus hoagii]|nr:hypothetical protein [Prescottella equi]NKS99428.1 hypothetical protein [Prescottella equi]
MATTMPGPVRTSTLGHSTITLPVAPVERLRQWTARAAPVNRVTPGVAGSALAAMYSMSPAGEIGDPAPDPHHRDREDGVRRCGGRRLRRQQQHSTGPGNNGRSTKTQTVHR